MKKRQQAAQLGDPALGRSGGHPGALAQRERVDIRAGQRGNVKNAVAQRLFAQEPASGVLTSQYRARCQAALTHHPVPELRHQALQWRGVPWHVGEQTALVQERQQPADAPLTRDCSAALLPARRQQLSDTGVGDLGSGNPRAASHTPRSDKFHSSNRTEPGAYPRASSLRLAST